MTFFHHTDCCHRDRPLAKSNPQRWTTFGIGLALLVAGSAHAAAQTLNLQSGDSVAVSGAGTQGIYQGQPVSNTTTTYTSNANVSAVSTSAGSLFTLGSGGTLMGPGDVLAVGGGTVAVNGGTITASGSGPFGAAIGLAQSGGAVTINQGNLSGDFAALLSYSGTAQINGGNFSSFSGFGDGLASFGGFVTINGGTFSGSTDLVAAQGGVLDLFGTFDGYHAGDMITSGGGTITGTLLNGEAINDSYFVNDSTPGSKIEFNVGPAPVPEASSAGSLGACLAFLGVLGIAGRKRGRQGIGQ